jgi:malate/lactate dehydrogenase
MRVTIIGASGKVARQALTALLFHDSAEEMELFLVARQIDRVAGAVADIVSALPLVRGPRGSRLRPPRVEIAGDVSVARRSDIVVLVAGAWPTQAQLVRLAPLDSAGRLAQSHVNAALVRALCAPIARHSPDALVVVVTNQSDMMATVARQVLQPDRVLGFGGIVDSARLRTVAARTLAIPASRLTRGNHMIGFHNADMLPLSSSLSFQMPPRALGAVVSRTRRYGQEVSRLQKIASLPDANSGASVLPGYAVYVTVAAYVGASPAIEEAFNVVLPARAARVYGVESGSALSVPVRLSRGALAIVDRYPISVDEQRRLRAGQRRMIAACDALAVSESAARDAGRRSG